MGHADRLGQSSATPFAASLAGGSTPRTPAADAEHAPAGTNIRKKLIGWSPAPSQRHGCRLELKTQEGSGHESYQ